MTIDALIHRKDYEKIQYFLHRHFITFLPIVILFIVLLILPAAALFLLGGYVASWFESPVIFPLVVLFCSIYYLSLNLFFYSYFITFYLDVWIITNDRLIDIRQVSLFSRTIAEVDLYQIQDVSSEVKGFFPSLFNFGNVYLQTAGPVPKFVLYNVGDPHRLRQAILSLSSEDKKYHNG